MREMPLPASKTVFGGHLMQQKKAHALQVQEEPPSFKQTHMA
jgi:hypothetical protein